MGFRQKSLPFEDEPVYPVLLEKMDAKPRESGD